MLKNLLPILPSLGLLLIIILGYFVFKQKMSEYNQKFTSMFSLLSAITDEINKLKKLNIPFQQIQVSDDLVDEDTSEYEEEEEEEDEEEDDDQVESEDEGEEEEDDDEGEEEEDDDEGDEEEDDKKLDTPIVNQTDLPSGEETTVVSVDIEEEIEKKEIIIDELEGIDFNKMSSKELKQLAKQRGFGGDNISKLKKQDIIDILNDKTVKIE